MPAPWPGVWHDIASQLVVNQTLLPALDSLLTALSTLTVSIWGLGLGVKSLLLQVPAVLREQDSTTSRLPESPLCLGLCGSVMYLVALETWVTRQTLPRVGRAVLQLQEHPASQMPVLIPCSGLLGLRCLHLDACQLADGICRRICAHCTLKSSVTETHLHSLQPQHQWLTIMNGC